MSRTLQALRAPALLLTLAAALGCDDSGASVLGNVMVDVQYDAGPDARKAGDALPAAGDGAAATPDAGAAPVACFSGTPTTQLQLLNACWSETTVAVDKTVMLPGGYRIGDPLPPLP
jgi:hypothetical protein